MPQPHFDELFLYWRDHNNKEYGVYLGDGSSVTLGRTYPQSPTIGFDESIKRFNIPSRPPHLIHRQHCIVQHQDKTLTISNIGATNPIEIRLQKLRDGDAIGVHSLLPKQRMSFDRVCKYIIYLHTTRIRVIPVRLVRKVLNINGQADNPTTHVHRDGTYGNGAPPTIIVREILTDDE